MRSTMAAYNFFTAAVGRETLTNKAALEVHGRATACCAVSSSSTRRQEAVEMLQMIRCSQHSRMHMGHFYLQIINVTCRTGNSLQGST